LSATRKNYGAVSAPPRGPETAFEEVWVERAFDETTLPILRLLARDDSWIAHDPGEIDYFLKADF
jgi:hypothetical protein